MSPWVVATAVLIGVVIAWLGITGLRAASGASRGRTEARSNGEAEDVEELEVFFVCRECGTEYRVTRLGELQIPRHCGEAMEVIRRPGGGAATG